MNAQIVEAWGINNAGRVVGRLSSSQVFTYQTRRQRLDLRSASERLTATPTARGASGAVARAAVGSRTDYQRDLLRQLAARR